MTESDEGPEQADLYGRGPAMSALTELKDKNASDLAELRERHERMMRKIENVFNGRRD